MRCPKCGNEIGEGYLYCEICGEDIHIVPDFEPEIEHSIRESLEAIVRDVEEESAGEKEESAEQGRQNKKLFLIFGLAAIGLVLIGLCFVFVGLYRNNSLEYQLSKAESCMASGKQDKAVSYYNNALNLDPRNAQIRFALAELYRGQGMDELFMEQLLEIIDASYSTEDAVSKAYKKLIDYYRAAEDYETINELLLACDNHEIISSYQEYMAKAPEFSYQEGNYAEVIPLKLSVDAPGDIFYTEDGSIPDKNSTIYAAPIFLETGDYEITAIFINKYGISSDTVSRSYHIDIIKPSAPEVQTFSGDYQYPARIMAEVPDGCEVFYTTDGSTPSDQSVRYVGSIPMPLGRSNFKFIMYSEEGVAGDITEREYALTLETDLTPEDAALLVTEGMIAKGKINDQTGTSPDTAGKYKYIFQYAITIKDRGDYYVIAEVYEDAVGAQTKTGSSYAVNVYDGGIYKLQPDGGSNYLLEEL